MGFISSIFVDLMLQAKASKRNQSEAFSAAQEVQFFAVVALGSEAQARI
jgi:hypothetical protein